jgi:hypothetical protein
MITSFVQYLFLLPSCSYLSSCLSFVSLMRQMLRCQHLDDVRNVQLTRRKLYCLRCVSHTHTALLFQDVTCMCHDDSKEIYD